MTPWETFVVLEAASNATQNAYQRELAQAWYTAALSRAKKLPALQKLLQPPKARALRGEELARRKAAHEEAIQAWQTTR
jgi:uncharacterized protein (DUF1501 family)